MGEPLLTFNAEQIRALESYGIKIIVQNTSPEAAKDKSLPRDSYLLTLDNGKEQWYDIVRGQKGPIFDAYYDMFGQVFVSMKWTEGTVPSKLWGYKSSGEAKKKK